MLSDDVFRSQLAGAFASLKQVAASFSDVARFDSAATPDFVRLSLIPDAAGACAVEIMLRADQHYDISLAAEFYEDRPIERFDLFEALILAVARGDVVQRHDLTVATGTERAVESIITLPGGQLWRHGYRHPGCADTSASDATVFRDRRFLPYRRG